VTLKLSLPTRTAKYSLFAHEMGSFAHRLESLHCVRKTNDMHMVEQMVTVSFPRDEIAACAVRTVRFFFLTENHKNNHVISSRRSRKFEDTKFLWTYFSSFFVFSFFAPLRLENSTCFAPLGLKTARDKFFPRLVRVRRFEK
jgi:hypothetical protein